MSSFNATISKVIPNIGHVIIPIKRWGFSDWKKARLILCSL